MKRFAIALPLVLLFAKSGYAQLSPSDGFIYAYTNYNSDTVYGFPCAALFSDSHSGFMYCTLGPGSAPIHASNFFGPTDESTQCNSNMRVDFTVQSDTPLRFATTAYGGVEYSFYLRDGNGIDFGSYYGWGDSVWETGILPAGSYTMEMYYAYSFYNGGSYATSELDVTALSLGAQANSYVVTQGAEFEGDLYALAVSDDYSLCILPDDVSLAAELQVNGTSPVLTPVDLTFIYEGHVQRPGLSQTVAMYNYALGRYVVVAGGIAPVEDEILKAIFNSSAAQYIGPNGELSSQITWAPINDEDAAADGWLHCVDSAFWRVTP